MAFSRLLPRIQEICDKAHVAAVAVAFHDYETSVRLSYQGDRWFHAASTFKVAILFALLRAADDGDVRLDDQLQVRNRFLSVQDGSPFRIERDRDGDSAVHRCVGRSMSLERLAHAMITRSSNLATNLLLDFLSVERIRAALQEAGVTGLEVRRGVEDIVAHQAGVNNETTADGLLRLFRVFLDEQTLSEESRRKGIEILTAQEFNSMIPARLPDGVRVAHKTGEISTHCHDAGIVFPPDRAPYLVAILTETTPETVKRTKAVADISHAIYRYTAAVMEKPDPHHEP
jgi:beta-lactamase class A